MMRHVWRGRYDTPRQSWTGQMRGDYATVEELRPGVLKVCLVTSLPIRPVPPASFLDVLRGWGHTWLWNKMKVLGGTDWLLQAIAGRTLIAVTDGSYIREHYLELCSAAFILECTQGGGCVTGAFHEESIDADAFRGELLGLMAVYLLLLVFNTVSPRLTCRCGFTQIAWGRCPGLLKFLPIEFHHNAGTLAFSRQS